MPLRLRKGNSAKTLAKTLLRVINKIFWSAKQNKTLFIPKRHPVYSLLRLSQIEAPVPSLPLFKQPLSAVMSTFTSPPPPSLSLRSTLRPSTPLTGSSIVREEKQAVQNDTLLVYGAPLGEIPRACHEYIYIFIPSCCCPFSNVGLATSSQHFVLLTRSLPLRLPPSLNNHQTSSPN